MTEEITLHGHSASSGIGLGEAVLLPPLSGFVPHHSVSAPDRAEERRRLERALKKSIEQLSSIMEREELADEYRQIFEAQLLFYQDPLILEEVRTRIDSGANAEAALVDTFDSFKKKMAVIDNQIIRERASDLDDVENRILSNLMEVPEGDIRIPLLRGLSEKSILIADDISPSLMLHVRHVAGIAIERGGVTGHMAILARSRGIPAVVGVEGLLASAQDGQSVLVDAESGRIVVCPGRDQRRLHETFAEQLVRSVQQGVVGLHTLADGTTAELWVNLNEPDDFADARVHAAAGIGLFRTEFIYLNQPGLFFMPEEQQAVYEDILRRARGRTVTLRVLDIGDDKLVGSSFYNVVNLHRESLRNLRGIQFLLANPRLLRSQLRAILGAVKAVGGGPCRLLLPMITGVEQVEDFRAHLVAAANESDCTASGLPLGVMLETPAACLMADTLAAHCDFFSVGTNDLAASLYAVDRVESLGRENSLYQPALYRMIAAVRRASARPLAVCGEVAAVPGLLVVLVGLGLRQFSIARTALPGASAVLANVNPNTAEELAQRALAASGEAALRRIAREAERATVP